MADTLRMTVGLYYSRNDNPVIVATYESTLAFARANVDTTRPLHARDDSAVTINLYPGWFSVAGLEPGVTLATRGTSIFLGISAGALPVGFDLGKELFVSPGGQRN